jgi:hypothetical protein
MASHRGETWRPKEQHTPIKEVGIYCPHCYTIHPWKSKKTLKAQYEKMQSGGFRILWVCKKTGNVIKYQPLLRK